MIEESRKHYIQGEVKAYVITDEVDQYNFLYKTSSATLHKFSAQWLLVLIYAVILFSKREQLI